MIRDPRTGTPVRLATLAGRSYPFHLGLPNLTYPKAPGKQERKTQQFYDSRADVYDKFLPLTFRTHRENEEKLRNSFVDCLGIRKEHRVLEVGGGTGRDSEIIARRLGRRGELFIQDLSPLMLRRCVERLKHAAPRTSFCLSNATFLPFPDRFFDAVYSFGGLGEFPDIRRALAEMVRVAKVGGKVVVGDESIPPWLRGTDFAKILITTNPQFEARLPLEEMPIEARDVRVRWVIGGVFYLIDFRVAAGEPDADFDFEIPGPRGGTYRTRHEGKLEGVTREAKELANRAVSKTGLSMHRWLDHVVREAACRDLGLNLESAGS